MNTPSATVSMINLFPVRSCAGMAVQEAMITPNGLILDRNWRLVTPAGKFLTQNNYPKMARIQPQFIDSRLHLGLLGGAQSRVSCSDNLLASPVPINENCHGIDQGDQIAEWLGTTLGVEARLLRITDVFGRSDFSRPNMSPVLVISEESLADLNTRLEDPVPMNRFRPNIVVRGLRPYEEETWTRVLIGEVLYEASSEPCGRCPMINIDQEKGERAGKEPLKTLVGYRRTSSGPVIFGKYMVPVSTGVVRVNDRINSVVG